jgi:IclR family transcriptional regulator, acetate operon repressor
MPRTHPTEQETMAPPTGTQAVDRASTLLVAVLESAEAVPFSQLAATADLPKSTVSRLLTSLERHGLVQRDADAAVRPGPVLTRFVGSGRTDSLVQVAQPHLDRVGDVTGETVNLAIPGPTGVEQIAQVSARYMLGAQNWVGHEVPFHCSALGKVFLAFGATPLPTGRLERRTERTLVSREDLQADLALVRRRGFAVADSELESGLVAVAAPVTQADGTVVAAVSVTGPSVRLTGDRIPGVGRLLVAEARAISQALGARSGTRTRRVGVA